jgi:hypothetical protein
MAIAVEIGCVKEVDSEIHSLFDSVSGFLIVYRSPAQWNPRTGHRTTNCPATETNFRDVNAGVAKLSMFHNQNEMIIILPLAEDQARKHGTHGKRLLVFRVFCVSVLKKSKK